jgi:hypothetical protein
MRGRNITSAISCTINDLGEITKAGSFELSIAYQKERFYHGMGALMKLGRKGKTTYQSQNGLA